MSAPESSAAVTDRLPVLTDEALVRPLDGHQLQGDTITELVKDRTTLLVFLRHFG